MIDVCATPNSESPEKHIVYPEENAACPWDLRPAKSVAIKSVLINMETLKHGHSNAPHLRNPSDKLVKISRNPAKFRGPENLMIVQDVHTAY